MSGDNVGSLSHASPKAEDDRRTEGNADLGQFASRTDRQNFEVVFKVTGVSLALLHTDR